MNRRFPNNVMARGRTARREPGKMNGLEAQYAAVLDERKTRGQIIEYWFERFTFKLADDTRYTPDFVVMLPDGALEVHEVKGFLEEDAFIKWKVAAEMFPFTFRMFTRKAKKDGGGWNERVIE